MATLRIKTIQYGINTCKLSMQLYALIQFIT